MSSPLLDPLSQRIVGALQIDGRASWRRIAEVLGEPVRTVARRGAALLEERTVQVVALPSTSPTYLLRVRCRAAATAAVAGALAARRETVFVYVVGEVPQVVAEVMAPDEDVARLVLDDLPQVDGIEEIEVAPALLYFRTVAEWSPGLLTQQEVAALGGGASPEPIPPMAAMAVDEAEQRLIDALVADGRTPLQEVAEILGCSDATARRRIEALVQRGAMRIRAVVEPALVGLPTETLVRATVAPSRATELGRALVASPLVRYCAYLAGGDQFLIDVTTTGVDQLRELLGDPDWIGGADRVTATPLLRAYKRGGVLVPRPS